MGAGDPWVSASDLADYAFCPRAHYYHEHPPDGTPDSVAKRRARVGRRYHAAVLGAERSRAEHARAYWAALLLGIGVAAGGMLWILRP